MKTGVLRWAFNVDSWDPSESEWEKCMGLLSGEPEEQERIAKFVRPLKGGAKLVGRHNPDAKSSLAGRLLIRKAVQSQLGVPCNSTTMRRTRLGKPYVVPTAAVPASPFPNFNLNVAHQGAWVVLAAEPHDLVGVDVMKNELRPNTTADKFLASMRSCFTDHEWLQVNEFAPAYNLNCGWGNNSDTDDILFAAAMSYGTPPASSLSATQARLDPFFTMWSLKESFVKATGLGLSFGLERTSFTFTRSAAARFEPEWVRPEKATVRVDGKATRSYWDFTIGSLDKLHIVACARTAPCEATDEETVWIERTTKEAAVCNARNPEDRNRPPFEELHIADLMK